LENKEMQRDQNQWILMFDFWHDADATKLPATKPPFVTGRNWPIVTLRHSTL
jgi:hypothetical protein